MRISKDNGKWGEDFEKVFNSMPKQWSYDYIYDYVCSNMCH